MEAGPLAHARGRVAQALARSDEHAARAAAAGDRRGELYAQLASSFVRFIGTPGGQSMAPVTRLATEARTEFEAVDDDLGVGLSWFALAHVHHNACRWQERQDALELAHFHGARAGDAYLQEHTLLWMMAGPVHGPMPTDEGLRWYDEHDTEVGDAPVGMGLRAVVEAMVGNFDRARDLVRDSTRRLEELGQGLWLAAQGMHLCAVEMHAGDAEAAAREALRSCAALEAIGEQGWLSTLAGQTAQALLELGRDDEAEHWVDVADEIGGADDVITQTLIRQVRAKLLAARAPR